MAAMAKVSRSHRTVRDRSSIPLDLRDRDVKLELWTCGKVVHVFVAVAWLA